MCVSFWFVVQSTEKEMALRSSCVKIYLCSNPADSVLERRALRERVFPRFRHHCRHTLGLDVRVIDPFESSDPSRWPDGSTRQELIEECRESSAGPFLLALVGHRYGAACLPTQVEVSEYQLLLQESQQAGINTQELERRYERDENTIPPSYCLRPPRRPTCSSQEAEVEEEVRIKAEEDELRRVFETMASLCVTNGVMTAESSMLYHRSALDTDLRFALHDHPQSDIIRRCLVYVHKVINAKGEREKNSMDSRPEPHPEDIGTADGALLSQLCDHFLPALITSSQLLVYTTTTECDRRHGYTTGRRRSYAESLCLQVHADLVGLMENVNWSESSDESQCRDALARAQAEQEELCHILSHFYDIIRPEEEKVRAFVEHSEHQLPLVVTGGPCTGKAVLLAHCAQQISLWLSGCDPVVIAYFCHLSINPSTKQLLATLCYQIASRYHGSTSYREQHLNDLGDPSSSTDPRNSSGSDAYHEHSDREDVFHCKQNLHLTPSPHPSDLIDPGIHLSELQRRFSSLLSVLPSNKQPLFLVLDGLDHIETTSGSQIIAALPSPLPPWVKVILSVSSNRTQVLQSFSPRRSLQGLSDGGGKELGYVCVPLGSVDRKQCVKMLASLLSSSGRRVTSGQQALVNHALTSCRLTLYARLLHLHTSLWHSDSDVTEFSLPDGVHSSISALLDNLEQKHGSSIVSRGVSYLTLSRTGLTEAELADLLSSDDEVLSGYFQRGERPSSKMRVLQVDVERLLLDLRRFLVRRKVAGLHVLFWVSRHFKLVVTKKYLFTPEARREIHSAMADYFSSQWACGKAKPFLVKENRVNTQISLNVDRHPASYPYDFTSSSKDHTRVNMRKLLELPYHLQESKKWEELERSLLMSLGFHQAMIQAGLLGDMVAMLASEDGLSHSHFSRGRAFIASILKSCACLLQCSPLELPTLMEVNLLPYLEVFPALKGYVKEIREERRKRGSILGAALCPAPSSVPSIHSLKCDVEHRGTCVTEAAGTECGSVALILDDGSAWFWKGAGCDIAKLSMSCEQKELRFAGVKSSAHFILLSSQCNKLFWWDLKGPELFLQLQDPLMLSQPTPSKVEGFVACQRKLFVWWKDKRLVSVFDVSREIVTHLQCQSCVTCLTCSSSSSHVYCGQEDGTLSIFDRDAGDLLGTWSNLNHNAVTWIMFCERTREVSCVDRAGNLTVWDVASGTHLVRVVKESFTRNEYDEVLSVDHSDKIQTLLVCQSHQVSLWGTCEWELWDQFMAPHGRAFHSAMLSQDGSLFLALLDSCPLILVWKVSTGECVLSLETNKRPHMLLKTALDVICIAVDGHLTVWDSESIDAAGATPTMDFGVKEVLVEPTGKCFYTSDGTETVWRWKLETGLPHVHLIHEGRVEKLCLSPDGLHLVILAAGEIYVWHTETGQNIVRVSNTRATDIMITPNSHFVVSISEQYLSRVWKLTQGSVICSIHLYMSDAQVTPESTFLIGRHHGDLLAASLWSGSIGKRFSCVASSEHVTGFHTLSEHPDFVVVMCVSGSVYTWKVSEETVCRHFQLPYTFHCELPDLQMSSDGNYALLSTEDEAITLLDISHAILRSFKADGPVIKACLDKGGCYAAYISTPNLRDKGCVCSLHMKPVLTVLRLADSKRIGRVLLSKNPLTLVLFGGRWVFVGFVDGSVGVYSISDVTISGEESGGCEYHFNGWLTERSLDQWLPLPAPSITWH